MFKKETLAGAVRDIHSRRLRALQQFPVIAVGGAVMQFAFVLDRPPCRILGGDQQYGGLIDLGEIRAHRFDDGQYLVRVDAPHAQEAEFLPGAAGVLAHHIGIAYFGGDIVAGHHAIAQCGGGNRALGAYDQRMAELAW